ncbi:hypothetical protein CRE_06156 [Caenorhabditis remanei]|uniref:Uncharacterized protein n=1 Tax=Caenorhabditis remanei TaxID=31234 RepID=E3NGV2_CAERE|nr:hypothetical protein CRE_06156 [Caenorhabditis remanei]
MSLLFSLSSSFCGNKMFLKLFILISSANYFAKASEPYVFPCYSCMSEVYENKWQSVYKKPVIYTDNCNNNITTHKSIPTIPCASICLTLTEEINGQTAYIRGCYDSILQNRFNSTITKWYRWMHRDFCRDYRWSVDVIIKFRTEKSTYNPGNGRTNPISKELWHFLKEIVRNMGFDETVGFEAAHKLSHTFIWGKNPQEFKLQNRKPSIWRCCSRRKLHWLNLRILRSPVIYTTEGRIPATYCESFGMNFGCHMAKGNCGFASYGKCPVNQRHTPGGI